MNNDGFISSEHVFDLSIPDLIRLLNFTSVAAVNRGVANFICLAAQCCVIYQFFIGFGQILPWKTVGLLMGHRIPLQRHSGDRYPRFFMEYGVWESSTA